MLWRARFTRCSWNDFEGGDGLSVVHVRGSPFTVTIRPTYTLAARCRARGGGLSWGVAGDALRFEVEARDALDNVRLEGGDAFDAVLHLLSHEYEAKVGPPYAPSAPGGRDAVVTGRLFDNATGTYEVAYRPLLAGRYHLSLTLHGLPVADSPYNPLAPWRGHSSTVTRRCEGTEYPYV